MRLIPVGRGASRYQLADQALLDPAAGAPSGYGRRSRVGCKGASQGWALPPRGRDWREGSFSSCLPSALVFFIALSHLVNHAGICLFAVF